MTDSWSAQLSGLVTSIPVTGLVAIALCVILLVKWLVTSGFDSDIPPFPARSYPILGHLPYLAKDQRGTLLKWRKTVGNVFSIHMGPKLFIVLNGYQTIKEALVTNAHAFSGRPERLFADDADFGVTFSNDEQWKEQRTLAMTILRSFGMGKSSLASKISGEITFYLNELAELKCADVKDLTKVSVANNIVNILIGRRFDYHDKFFVAFMENMAKMEDAADTCAISMMWPWLRRLPGNVLSSKTFAYQIKAIVTNFCDRFIKETREAEEKPHCFITEYDKEIEKLKKLGTKTSVNDDNLRHLVFQLFSAGTDTTAVSIVWVLNYMIHYPDVQSKVYEEIVKAVGRETPPGIEDKPKLPFTQAVIKETMRITSIFPTNVPHRCDEDTIIQGYRIPAGATVLPSLDSVLWDEDLWENPMTYRPERFLDESGKCTSPEELIPFSTGRRLCLGDNLAKMELFLYISALIQKFEVLPSDPNNMSTLEGKAGLMITPVNTTFTFRDRKSEGS